MHKYLSDWFDSFGRLWIAVLEIWMLRKMHIWDNAFRLCAQQQKSEKLRKILFAPLKCVFERVWNDGPLRMCTACVCLSNISSTIAPIDTWVYWNSTIIDCPMSTWEWIPKKVSLYLHCVRMHSAWNKSSIATKSWVTLSSICLVFVLLCSNGFRLIFVERLLLPLNARAFQLCRSRERWKSLLQTINRKHLLNRFVRFILFLLDICKFTSRVFGYMNSATNSDIQSRWLIIKCWSDDLLS